MRLSTSFDVVVASQAIQVRSRLGPGDDIDAIRAKEFQNIGEDERRSIFKPERLDPVGCSFPILDRDSVRQFSESLARVR